MIYCNLDIDSAPVWSGVPCLNYVLIKSQKYIPFLGELFFVDTQGTLDPYWEGFADRFVLAYLNTDGVVTTVPLDPTPSQILDIDLGGQNCTLAIFSKELF